MRKKSYLLLMVSMIIVFQLTGCSTGAKEVSINGDSYGNETSQIRFGIDAGISTLPFRVAEEQGYFNNSGLEPTIASFAYGIDTINALFTEQTDTGFAADYPILNSLGKGDLVILGTISKSTEQTNKDIALFATGNIKSGKDLKGKKLGVAKGTVYEYIWSKYLEIIEIDEDEVTFVPFSSPDEAIIGVNSGDIDAVWAGGAINEKFKTIQGVEQIDDLNGAGVSINLYLIGQRAFVEQNPTTVENALRALNKGVEFVQNNKEDSAKIAFEQIKLPEEDVLRDLENMNYVVGFTKEDADHLEQMKKWLEERGTLTDQYDLKDKLNLEPLKKALPETVSYQE